ncbi:hypothetical protein CLAFUW4_13981 [Fulvia fulva]|uniref:Uncharacterized protein n=1 Tax=Passalora fulva TaxID=5499 RepID=A0A9Q8UVR5_PASFU|nr:uncharacterized protein CLAFUR5_13819 [Fulvia fulva]KAK4610415.1 hypothetical protein CLAFUR4_13984 [Fulvia fulva]KAK4611242.1 hypothetical protein CLAFUR0_13988 [Fulvia fulva]UJO24147.1 hypothetical protein CLAFUR5_13819 [Fulvia fulva]WPV21829.1 hypothetical protein CLAFUW4_13981 [Fulvia fulva]WPV36677.1 hypothetical protein CLAFUW7_13989 [Fulvia fulva]
MERPRIPSEAEVEAIEAQIKDLEKPLEDEIMNNEWRQDNTVVAERLGNVNDRLQQRITRQNVDIKAFEKERRKVVKEIEVLKTDVQGGSNGLAEANQKHQAQMQALQDEIKQVEKLAEAEREKLRKEERAENKKLNNKLKGLLA